jgi:hypothetical protein
MAVVAGGPHLDFMATFKTIRRLSGPLGNAQPLLWLRPHRTTVDHLSAILSQGGRRRQHTKAVLALRRYASCKAIGML